MKLLLPLLYTLTLTIFSSSAYAKKTYSPPQTPNGIAAIVEKRIVTYDDVQRKLTPLVPQIQAESTSQEDFGKRIDTTGRQILEEIIDEILIVNEFNTKKGAVPETFLNNQYFSFIKENFQGDRSLFQEYLKAQGQTDRQFRESQKENAILSFVRFEIERSQSEISPEKIQKYYKENSKQFYQDEAIHLKQITLSPVANEGTNLLMQEADKALEELKSGKSFEDVAKRFSQDSMKERGGDWSWLNRKDIRKELADIAFSMAIKTHSNPIQIGKHVFILFVEDKRKDGIQPLDKVRDQIEKTISANISKHAYNQRLERLRKKTHVKYFL